ncbi:MAG: SDR family oxidoreductase [Anaerolineae bacterium]|nr:SDR family oxidoreductase [Anaerolineae bacterium]
MYLTEKVALVTGGAVRLGKAIALGLAEAGADIVITYSSSEGPAQETAAEIRALGREAVVIQADFGRSQDMSGLADAVLSKFGHWDILINSAAIFEPGEWDSTDEANWDRHFDINLKAPFFLTQAFALAAKARGYRGHVVNIADWRGARPGTDHVAYTLTKVALIGMTQSMALALAPEVQVNAIAPGLILPPPGASEAFVARKATEIPLARPGSPAEIVHAVRYLLASDFVTGELIYVTGGEHL